MSGKKQAPTGQKKSGGGGKTIFLMIVAGAMVPFGMPTLLVCAGLLPTLVALITDTDDHKSAAATVGFMNLAGVFPFVLDLWDKGQTMEAAVAIVREPTNWLIMLGSAAIGQLLLYTIPAAVASMTVAQYESRVAKLREAMAELKAVWGPDVASASDLDEVRRHNG